MKETSRILLEIAEEVANPMGQGPESRADVGDSPS
jgi:hypothetical protein